MDSSADLTSWEKDSSSDETDLEPESEQEPPHVARLQPIARLEPSGPAAMSVEGLPNQGAAANSSDRALDVAAVAAMPNHDCGFGHVERSFLQAILTLQHTQMDMLRTVNLGLRLMGRKLDRLEARQLWSQAFEASRNGRQTPGNHAVPHGRRRTDRSRSRSPLPET